MVLLAVTLLNCHGSLWINRAFEWTCSGVTYTLIIPHEKFQLLFTPLLLFSEKYTNRDSVQSKVVPKKVDQVALVGKMYSLGSIGDNGKGWRGCFNLGSIVKSEPAPFVIWRVMPGNSIFEKLIERTCWKTLVELSVHLTDLRKNAFYSLAGKSRDL